MYLAEQPFLISGRGPSAWRLLVGGSLPYLAFSFFKNQFIVTCVVDYVVFFFFFFFAMLCRFVGF